MSAAIVALDGMAFGTPRPLKLIVLAPSLRCDVIGDVTGPVVLMDYATGAGHELGVIRLEGTREPSSAPPPSLPLNAMPIPGPETQHVILVMQGGAGGAAHGGFGGWALNDTSGLPRLPLVNVERGTTVRVTLCNDTAFDHVMHLHGHHFWEMTKDGCCGDYRDGTFIAAGAARDILCVLDNLSAWMFHCHMLSHQTDGMATWMQVR